MYHILLYLFLRYVVLAEIVKVIFMVIFYFPLYLVYLAFYSVCVTLWAIVTMLDYILIKLEADVIITCITLYKIYDNEHVNITNIFY